MFYVYATSKGEYVTVNGLKIGLTSKEENMAYWTKKKDALTWKSKIEKKYPFAVLHRAHLMVQYHLAY